MIRLEDPVRAVFCIELHESGMFPKCQAQSNSLAREGPDNSSRFKPIAADLLQYLVFTNLSAYDSQAHRQDI
jgi:hypothetical protein